MAERLPDPVAPEVIARDARLGPLSGLVPRLSALPVDKLLIYLIDQVDARLLPDLARQFHILGDEGWHLAHTDSQRRALIKRSITMHRRKGTPWAIKEALKAAGFHELLLEERLPVTRYDGAITYGGAQHYAAFGWAQFRAIADVGDAQPIHAGQTEKIAATIHAWKPERCHLVDIRYRASSTDLVDTSETALRAGALTAADPHRWGKHFYDGALAYNQGTLHTYDGAQRYGAAATYSGWSVLPGGARYDSQREQESLGAQAAWGDRQMCVTPYDARLTYSGYADYGATAPVAEDPPMPILLRRHRRYDGRRRYGQYHYDGETRYAGLYTHMGTRDSYSGDRLTQMEAP